MAQRDLAQNRVGDMSKAVAVQTKSHLRKISTRSKTQKHKNTTTTTTTKEEKEAETTKEKD